MSSMQRVLNLVVLSSLALFAAPALAQEGREWDLARTQNASTPRSAMGQAIERWRLLSKNDGYPFSEYAGFLLSYPGFPDEAKIRGYAERALTRETVETPRLIAFFDRVKPTTNPAKALYALALSAAGRPEARAMALEAWRGGAMSEASAAALQSQFGSQFSSADHDARMIRHTGFAGPLPAERSDEQSCVPSSARVARSTADTSTLARGYHAWRPARTSSLWASRYA